MDAARLEAQLADGNDNALLRYTLGSLYFRNGEAARAVPHLARAVALDPQYSAAWKIYGRSLAAAGAAAEAGAAFRRGIEVAEARGDRQAAREMQVFLKRLEKSGAAPSPGSDPGSPPVR